MADFLASFYECDGSNIDSPCFYEFNNRDESESIPSEGIVSPDLENPIFYKFGFIQKNHESLSTDITEKHLSTPNFKNDEPSIHRQVWDKKKDSLLNDEYFSVEESENFNSDESVNESISSKNSFKNTETEESDTKSKASNSKIDSSRHQPSNVCTVLKNSNSEKQSISLSSESKHNHQASEVISSSPNKSVDQEEVNSNAKSKRQEKQNKPLSINEINSSLSDFHEQFKSFIQVDMSNLKYGKSLCKSIIKALFTKRKDFIVISIIRAHNRMLSHAKKDELTRTETTLDYVDFCRENSKQLIMFKEFQKNFLKPENFEILNSLIPEKPQNEKKLINESFCKRYFDHEVVRESFYMFIDILFEEDDFAMLSRRFKIKKYFEDTLDSTKKETFWPLRKRFLRELMFMSKI